MKSLGLIFILGVIVIFSLYSPVIKPFFMKTPRRNLHAQKPPRLYALLFTLFLFGAFCLPSSAETLTQILVSKKLAVNTCEGIIFSNTLKYLNPRFSRRNISASVNSKTYSLYAGDPYGSVIFTRPGGNYISVGRRAVKFIPQPSKHRLYVLCEGYFGSVYEIDTIKDIVVRKIPTVCNPTDMALSGDKLVVTGVTVQIIDTDMGQVSTELELPRSACYATRVTTISGNKIGVTVKSKKGGSVSLSLDISKGKETYNLPFTVKQLSDRNKRNLFFLTSKNNDYITLISPTDKGVVGIIALDAPADKIYIANNKTKAYVLHNLIGQISIIDLNPESAHYLSVISRKINKNFERTDLQFSEFMNNIYVWNGEEDIFAVINIKSNKINYDNSNLNDIKLGKEEDKGLTAYKIKKNFYLKDSLLSYQDFSSTETRTASPLMRIDSLVRAFDLNSNQKFVYSTHTDSNVVKVFNTADFKEVKTIPMHGMPTDVLTSYYANELYVLDSSEGSVSILDLKKDKVRSTFFFDAGFNNSRTIKIYDETLKQLVSITMPVYTNNSLKMIKGY